MSFHAPHDKPLKPVGPFGSMTIHRGLELNLPSKLVAEMSIDTPPPSIGSVETKGYSLAEWENLPISARVDAFVTELLTNPDPDIRHGIAAGLRNTQFFPRGSCSLEERQAYKSKITEGLLGCAIDPKFVVRRAASDSLLILCGTSLLQVEHFSGKTAEVPLSPNLENDPRYRLIADAQPTTARYFARATLLFTLIRGMAKNITPSTELQRLLRRESCSPITEATCRPELIDAANPSSTSSALGQPTPVKGIPLLLQYLHELSLLIESDKPFRAPEAKYIALPVLEMVKGDPYLSGAFPKEIKWGALCRLLDMPAH
jgi:hypothetical protein